MLKNSCRLALKELKRWMVPEKVDTFRSLFHTGRWHCLVILLIRRYDAVDLLSSAGENLINNFPFICWNSVRTLGSCTNNLSLELSLLYVFFILTMCTCLIISLLHLRTLSWIFMVPWLFSSASIFSLIARSSSWGHCSWECFSFETFRDCTCKFLVTC